MKKIIMLLILIFLITNASAVCTLTLDKDIYHPEESATAEIQCSEAIEKNKEYILYWYNGTKNIYNSTGTTSSTTNEKFFASYLIPTGTSWTNANATLTGTNLEGYDIFNVSGAATTDLIITNKVMISPILLGKLVSVSFDVEDNNGKKVTNAQCKITQFDNNNKPIGISAKILKSIAGNVAHTQLITNSNFDEGKQYRTEIYCYCGINNTTDACINEDGDIIEKATGTSTGALTTNTWLTVNTTTDKSVYNPNQEIFICANVTNVEYTSRIPIQIYHQIRCSSETDNNQDTDRALIISDGESPDERGISTNTTQMQCKRFVIPDAKYLQGKTSECYASTTTWVLNSAREKIMGYPTTSPVFNITFNNLQLYSNWEQISEYKWNTIINLSTRQFQEYSGTGTGNIQIHLAHPEIYNLDSKEQYGGQELPFNNLLLAEQIDSIEAFNTTGEISTSLHYKKLGQLDLILKDVNLSSGWYNITINLNSFNERQAEALEGIENKTGTFHLDITCPSYGTIGDSMTCAITAQIEDPQLVRKEVDFTCYISDGTSIYSSINFNQMITQAPITISRAFPIPSTFIDNQQYILQCYADYYNLGSRRDSFYDTFTATGLSQGGSGTSDSTELPEGKPIEDKTPITGGTIGIGDIKEETHQLIIIITIIFIITILILLIITKTKKQKHTSIHTQKNNQVTKIIILSTAITIATIITAAAIYYTTYYVPSIFSQVTKSSFFKKIISITFITAIIIILFRALNIQINIKVNQKNPIEDYWKDKKYTRLQKKFNRRTIKHQLKHNQ